MLWNIASTFIALVKVTSARVPQPFHQSFASIDSQEIIFELHNNTVYLSNVQHPKAVYYGSWGPSERPLWIPLTAVSVNTSKVTEDDIKRTIQDYIDQDDVFNLAFLEAVLLQTATEGVIEKQAIDYLRSLNVSTIFVPPKVTIPSGASIGTVTIVPESQNQHVEGPFVAALKENAFYLYPVWRLYSDLYSVFLQGSYDPGDGSGIYRAVGAQNTKFFEQPLIPVPSRIYSWRDPRPLAGARVGVKDLFDVKGLQTTGGRGHIVGKQKLAQFASAADPWLWQDERPSQGMMSLDLALPVSHPSDTTGVFTRDPKKWAHFSKAWYTTTMQQNSTLTGLPAYDVPNTNQFPKRLVYLSEFSPQNQAATEPIWQSFISNLTQLFNMTTETINFTAVAQSAPEPAVPIMLEDKTMNTIWTWDQWRIIGKPLINAWTRLSDGRFPPLDPTHRDQWQRFLTDPVKEEDFQEALESRAKAVTWFEESVLFSTNESCSESLLVYDIGPGGFPSYREDVLNKLPNTTYVYKKADDAAILGASICPIFGCADYTIPIGEVPYKSAVTLKTEMMPVSMNLVVKRGCDFVLFNMIERLADAGLLRTVKAGRTLF
ncbi:hypothetical protein ETB97_005128 [Aspergillus alliaceus]|uniref:Scytalone dehydratase-like protein Arp1 N-terminal domain-containing protein n=1 Tax=Petromyces alliaceus TaxID=209559 RepID=A0A8H6A219_PETAA|nr:hypothetical protein ETB97_005128 [Aspergillus burnettii]